MKKSLIYGLFSIFLVCAIAASSYFIYVMTTRIDDTLKISLVDNKRENLEFNVSNVYPGYKFEQNIDVLTNVEKSNLKIDFTFLENQLLLPFLDLDVKQEGTTLYSGKLESVSIQNVYFSNETSFTFTFLMNENVDNSAQGQEVDMIITFSLVAEL